MSSRSARRILLAGMAVVGIVVGHTLTYVLAIREPLHRGEHLARAGHSYWSAAVWVAITLGVCCALGFFLAGMRRTRREDTPVISVLGTSGLLAALQTTGFLLLETGERVITGTPLSEIVSHDLFAVGLLIEAALAVAGVFFLRWLLRAARLLAAVLARAGDRAESSAPGRAAAAVRRAVLPGGAWGARGPPVVRTA